MFAVITLTANVFTPKLTIESFWTTKEAAKNRVDMIRHENKPATTKKLAGVPTAVSYTEVNEGPWQVPAKTMDWLRDDLRNIERISEKVACAQEAIYNHLKREEEQGTTLHESARAYGLRLGVITE